MVRSAVGVVAALAVTLVASASAVAQQASLTLKDSNAEFCHHNTTHWCLEKTGTLKGCGCTLTAEWKVTVTKTGTSHNFLVGDGFVRVQNTGTAPATIGNIVVNLQRKSGGQKWYTVCSDIADATHGDAATWANIVAGASSEGLSFFKEGPGSGPLSFTDASNNTLWSITPQVSIAPGASIDLLFSAQFDNSILNIPVGAQIRLEVIVTFGNAGARGGSGASGGPLDINGNCTIDCDEKNVRSVPTRFSREVPPLEECNKTVTLFDQITDLQTHGTVTFDPSTYTSDIPNGGIAEVSETTTFTITVVVTGGTCGGRICNTATLSALPEYITVNGPLDECLKPIYSYKFVCCPEIHIVRTSCIGVPKDDEPELPPPPPPLKKYTTYTKGAYGAPPNGNNPAKLLQDNFATAFPSGIEVGIPGPGGFSMQFTSSTAVGDYLPGSDGTPGALTADLVNPTSSSSGNLGEQVLALRISVGLSAANVTLGGLGDLVYHNAGDSLDGFTVSQILAAANTALGGGALPAGYTYATLNDLITNLNEAFDNGTPTAWATAHLSES